MKDKLKKLISKKVTKITGVLVLILMFSFGLAFYTNDIDAQKANGNDTLISNQNNQEEVSDKDEFVDTDEETTESSENTSASTNQDSKDNSKGKNNSSNSNSSSKPASSSSASNQKPSTSSPASKPAPSKPAPTCTTKTVNHPAEYKTVKGSPAVYETQTWFGFNDGKIFINDGKAADRYSADTGQNYSVIDKKVMIKPATPDKKVLVKAAWTEQVKVCK